ncbi:MAG: DDE-type integrase/transposase/recombinase [Ktedonobacteraceae bacterium]
MYLSLARDSQGTTREFFLRAPRDAPAAKRFLTKALSASHIATPGVITVDKNAASPKALNEWKAAGMVAVLCELRHNKDLTQLIEQDHRFIKGLVKPAMGFFSVEPAWRAWRGYEIRTMLRKGQMPGVNKGDGSKRAAFMAELFGVAI